ncbi:MAG TPA: nucleoside deaminase [Erysipelotrichaceae bacterium]|nr:nucleoside deaminase [Erysipelotrichaceae bacterium]HAO61368.1 nucleoside deaminase [Erysipelotrichaceae bacterium]HBZ41420.1 nucleoside deaminase [Erysipelotrichaceae bacterium]
MDLAAKEAKRTMREGIGGPFGAVILTADHELVCVASNTVLRDHDPTAHSEINAIRSAGKTLNTHDLSGCILVTTCYPCPMCLSAALWANIATIVYGCTAKDAAMIGFRDDFIHQYLVEPEKNAELVRIFQSDPEKGLSLFREYHESRSEMY